MSFINLCIGVITICQMYNLIRVIRFDRVYYKFAKEAGPLFEQIKLGLKIFVPQEKEPPPDVH